MTQIHLFIALLLSCCLLQKTSSFSLGPTISTSRRTRSSDSKLFAVKPPKKSKKNKKPAGGGGGGFGSSSADASNANNNSKVRSVSGYQGSGTKPLRIAANTFDALRQEYGEDACHDIYVRSPLNDASTFWFVGKVARCMDITKLESSSTTVAIIPTPHDAVISQKRLILEYAKRQLRPQNMGGPFSEGLELWIAASSGDREMDAVQNKISLDHVTGSLASLSDGFHVANVGYNPEIYVGDEVTKGGLRIVRDEEGKPVKPVFEINESVKF
eukprot:CAMPEP_0119008622 /NCGR_PEP_ID=MMETSP1176-20130426/3826_1 /TAXON_ID=265551 /ORGANISM="Synedropsis recta cf, Strain CCMP1620" /LENGTH=270 /DNA_ID=CAMNT_0006960987 /DNA_START=18 /DNA_END=828 /DNA_ORIENTATION=-